MRELADFSALDGAIPCVSCKGEAHRTIMGDHWKCSACAHIFNEDGSSPEVMCLCDKCQVKAKKQHDKKQKKFLKEIAKLVKKAEQEKKAE